MAEHRDLVVRVNTHGMYDGKRELMAAFREAFLDVMKGRSNEDASFEAFAGKFTPSDMGDHREDDWTRLGGVEVRDFP